MKLTWSWVRDERESRHCSACMRAEQDRWFARGLYSRRLRSGAEWMQFCRRCATSLASGCSELRVKGQRADVRWVPDGALPCGVCRGRGRRAIISLGAQSAVICAACVDGAAAVVADARKEVRS